MENVLKKSNTVKSEYSSEEKTEPRHVLEILADEYESILSKNYRNDFIIRLLFIFINGYLSIALTYYYLRPEEIAGNKYSILFMTILCSIISITIVFTNISKFSTYQTSLKTIEKTFVKEKLKETSPDQKLKNELENFYIQMNYLTVSRYKIYFKSVYYEFITYGVITFLLAGYMTLKLFWS